MVGRNGSLQIRNGESFFVMDTSFSYPGRRIGWNVLSEREKAGETNWKPRVTRVNDSHLRLAAAGTHYALTRDVRLKPGRITIEDTLTNLRNIPVGIMIAHSIVTPGTMSHVSARNSATTPMLFFSQKGGDFGLVAEDDIGRLQFDCTSVRNNAHIRHSNFALDAGKSYTFSYAAYPMEETGDLYGFVNTVRRDWKTNFTIQGPFHFMDATSPMLNDKQALKRYLERKNLKLVALAPFLDYDPGAMDHVLPREEFKALAKKAARALREVRPDIKVLGCIEADWVTIYPEKMKDGHLIAKGTPQQIARVVDEADLPWKDSIKRGKDGTVRIEYYRRGGKPQFALGVYPAPGNYQHKFLLEQAEFLMDDVGLDGFYIDEFSQAWCSIRSYNGWDGFSVDIDSSTGQIVEKYVDCGLVGVGPRVDIINSAVSRDKVIVANTYATARAEQSLPVQRFAETQGYVNAGILGAGKKPQFVSQIFDGALASPIGLGVIRVPDQHDMAEGLMLAVICYLRHGAVIYHYAYPDLPETGAGSGEYGPINHMFPITPVRLFEGGIVGKERIITAKSLENVLWDKAGKPIVHLFDITGREVKDRDFARIYRQGGKWSINLKLNDWEEIAVIE